MPRLEYVFTNMVLGNPRLRYFVEALRHDPGVQTLEWAESEQSPYVFRVVVQVGPEGLENKGLQRELSPFELIPPALLSYREPLTSFWTPNENPQFVEFSYVSDPRTHPRQHRVGTWVRDDVDELFQILRIDPAANLVLALTEHGSQEQRQLHWLRSTTPISTPGAFKIWRQMGRSKAFLPCTTPGIKGRRSFAACA